MDRTAAEALAIAALVWIAGNEAQASAFLGASGADASDLRARAGDPEFLGFVLEFLLMSDDSITAFCAESGHRPEDVPRARAGLPGGDIPSWT